MNPKNLPPTQSHQQLTPKHLPPTNTPQTPYIHPTVTLHTPHNHPTNEPPTTHLTPHPKTTSHKPLTTSHFPCPTSPSLKLNAPPTPPLYDPWYPNIQQTWSRCTSRRIYDPIFGVRALVIHATAGSTSDGAISVMHDGKASFHWLIPAEHEPAHGRHLWACAPEARAAWHVQNQCSHPQINNGATKCNHWSLAVELVNRQTQDDPFSPWQLQTLATLIRYAWAKYPNLHHITAHALLDPARRTDPGPQFPWPHLQSLVLNPPRPLL